MHGRSYEPRVGTVLGVGCLGIVFTVLFYAAIIGGCAVALKWALGR